MSFAMWLGDDDDNATVRAVDRHGVTAGGRAARDATSSTRRRRFEALYEGKKYVSVIMSVIVPARVEWREAQQKRRMAKMTRQQDARLGRRAFLRTFGVATTVVAATGPLGDQARADTEKPDERRKSRYRETDHVKTFYRVNRYPAK